MRHSRPLGMLVLGFGFVWLALPHHSTAAQPQGTLKDPYRKEAPRPGTEVNTAVTKMRDGELEVGINPKGPNGPKHQEYLKKMAEFLVFPVTHKEFYTTTIERKTPEGKKIDLGLPDRDKTLEGILFELERYVAVPDARSKAPTNQSEYIQEFGKALDAAVQSILNDPSNTPPPVKLNAVRALAVACKSGARVHAKTVISLLTEDKWPLYLKVHALHAAENLLAAGDIRELQGPNPHRHSIPDDDLTALVKAIEGIIVRMNKDINPQAEAAATPAPAPAKPTTPTPPPAAPTKPAEQPPATLEATVAPLDPNVALYVRKQAVKALSKVRVVTVPGPNRTIAARPGVTLARIAVGDPWFAAAYPPTATELADAVSGLATLHLDNTTAADVLLDAIAVGVSGFGGEKVRSVANGAPGTPEYRKLVPWKKTAAQLAAALNTLRNSPDRNPAALPQKATIAALVSTCSTYVLQPIEAEREGGTAAPVNQTMVEDFRKQIARKSDLMVPNDPDSKVTFPNQRAAGR